MGEGEHCLRLEGHWSCEVMRQKEKVGGWERFRWDPDVSAWLSVRGMLVVRLSRLTWRVSAKGDDVVLPPEDQWGEFVAQSCCDYCLDRTRGMKAGEMISAQGRRCR